MAFSTAPTPASGSGPAHGERYTDNPMAMGVITTIFFMWGFLTALNDILIPHLKAVFGLDYTNAILVQLIFFGTYFVMSLPAGRVVASLGYKKGIVTGLAISALGAVCFWPAATVHSYPAFLGAFFVLATGITVLQVAANPYVALLGPERTSSSRLTLAQALNSLGTTLAPLVGGLLILAAASTTLPKGIHAAPETKQLVASVNQAAPDQGLKLLSEAPTDRATAAIKDASSATLENFPVPGFAKLLDQLTPQQLGETLSVLPNDELLTMLKAQSPERINAMPADKLVAAIDGLASSKLNETQSADLQQIRNNFSEQAKQSQQSYRNSQADLVKAPYIGLAVVLVLLAIGVWLFKLPSLTETTGGIEQTRHTLVEALQHPHVLFGVIGIFFYVGAEVSIGSFLVNYLSLPEIGHISANQATNYVSLYWGGAMVGRVIGSGLMVRISPRKLLALFATIAALLVLVTMLTTSSVAVWSVVVIGLFNSIMFPTIFSLGIERLGPLTGKATSLLIMAIVGGAVIPFLHGVLADHIGLQHAFFLPLLCYLYIVFYGLSGSKVRSAA